MAEEHACLIVGPNWVGDMVMAQCLLKALRHRDPDLAIDVMAPPWTAPLVSRMPEVRAAIEVPFRHGQLQLAARWRHGRAIRGLYSEAYILPGSIKSALTPWLARIPRRVGYLGEHRYGLINDVRPLPVEGRRRTARLFQSLADTGALREPQLAVNLENQHHLCEEFALVPGAYVALAPAAEFGPSKRWPADRYAALARHYQSEGRVVIILGSRGDHSVGAAICRDAPGAINLCGRTSLTDVVDLLAGAALAVTNDSGLMHIAAAVGVPLVAVYGSTLPDHTPPISRFAITVTRRLDCAPCFQRTCPYGHTNCLNKLETGVVLEAGEAAIRRAGGG